MANAKTGKAQSEIDPLEVVIQYEFVQMLTEHLTDCWQVFDGDLGEMIVLAILGQAQMDLFRNNKAPIRDFGAKMRFMNASGISEVSKIPRQTVRRKLLQLAEKGWVVRDSRGGWGLAMKDGHPRARNDLHHLHLRGLERAKRMVTVLKPLV